jgi:hypothetical protein
MLESDEQLTRQLCEKLTQLRGVGGQKAAKGESKRALLNLSGVLMQRFEWEFL